MYKFICLKGGGHRPFFNRCHPLMELETPNELTPPAGWMKSLEKGQKRSTSSLNLDSHMRTTYNPGSHRPLKIDFNTETFLKNCVETKCIYDNVETTFGGNIAMSLQESVMGSMGIIVVNIWQKPTTTSTQPVLSNY